MQGVTNEGGKKGGKNGGVTPQEGSAGSDPAWQTKLVTVVYVAFANVSNAAHESVLFPDLATPSPQNVA